jgi:hypothetical protein
MKIKTHFLMCIGLFLCLYALAFAGGYSKVIDGNGTWTDELYVEKGGYLNLSIGSYNATTDMRITLKRRLPGDSNCDRDIDYWDVTGDSEDKEYTTCSPAPEDCYFRLGCDNATADDYTSGNCTVRIGTTYNWLR